jgi:hypothetical protein
VVVTRRSGGAGPGRIPGTAEGFCPRDGTPFTFLPPLSRGDVVNSRYEIHGVVLAYGLEALPALGYLHGRGLLVVATAGVGWVRVGPVSTNR